MDVKKLILLVSIALFFTACNKSEPVQQTVFSQGTKNCAEQRIKNQFIVKYKNGTYQKLKFKNKEEFMKKFFEENKEDIEIAEYDYKIIHTKPLQDSSITSKYLRADNWGQENINAQYAWAQGVTGQEIIVAVIDDGVDIYHNQLTNQIYYNPGENGVDVNGNDKSSNGIDDDFNGYVDDFAGYNFASDIPYNINTGQGHGSHVAGIIGAEHHDTEIKIGAVQGVAPGAKIMPLDFIDTDPMGNTGGSIADAIEAIQYAANNGAHIINASWGGPNCSKSLSDAIFALAEKNVLFVAASGNEFLDIDFVQQFPASFLNPTQITVGATDYYNLMTDFSNYGDLRTQIFAPGKNILSTVPTNNIFNMSGTSMATPFVSGVAALVWSKNPALTAIDVKNIILNNVYYDPNYRNSSKGKVDVQIALDNM